MNGMYHCTCHSNVKKNNECFNRMHLFVIITINVSKNSALYILFTYLFIFFMLLIIALFFVELFLCHLFLSSDCSERTKDSVSLRCTLKTALSLCWSTLKNIFEFYFRSISCILSCKISAVQLNLLPLWLDVRFHWNSGAKKHLNREGSFALHELILCKTLILRSYHKYFLFNVLFNVLYIVYVSSTAS